MSRFFELMELIRGQPFEWLLSEAGLQAITEAARAATPEDRARLQLERMQMMREGKVAPPCLIDDAGQTFFTDEEIAKQLRCPVSKVIELRETLTEVIPEFFSPVGNIHLLQ